MSEFANLASVQETKLTLKKIHTREQHVQLTVMGCQLSRLLPKFRVLSIENEVLISNGAIRWETTAIVAAFADECVVSM